MKLKKDWLVKIAVVVLGVGIVSAANATTIKQSLYGPPQGSVVTAPAGYQQVSGGSGGPQVSIVSADAVNQMIQACWQIDQQMVDQWVKATGLSRDDLLKMEQAWMQGVMQQNVGITVSDAYKLHQTWMESFLTSPQPPQGSTVQAAAQQQLSPPAQPSQTQGSYRQQTQPNQNYQAGQPRGNNRNYNGYYNGDCSWNGGGGDW